MKSFEKSIFCFTKSLVPKSIDKTITTTPFGGAIFHFNSLMRNKNVNDLVPYYPTNKVQEKLKDYRNQRSKVIYNKDYIYHINHTFVTNKNMFNDYEYMVY